MTTKYKLLRDLSKIMVSSIIIALIAGLFGAGAMFPNVAATIFFGVLILLVIALLMGIIWAISEEIVDKLENDIYFYKSDRAKKKREKDGR